MKRFVLFLFAIFTCAIAYAEQITINWGVDNQPYTTTTCEIGGDVILPSVSKRGYIFRGWTPEHFNRGTWATWTDVPTQANLYPEDYVGSRTPINNDYMVVSDASGFVPSDSNVITLYHDHDYYNIRYTYYDANTQSTTEGRANPGQTFGLNNELRLKAPGDGNIYIYAQVDNIVFENVAYNTGDLVYQKGWTATDTEYFYILANPLDGSWRFIYVGDWDTLGKTGWKPDVQISNE